MNPKHCRHCHKPTRAKQMPRGLCHRCYFDPAIVTLYPRTKSGPKKRGEGEYEPARDSGGVPICVARAAGIPPFVDDVPQPGDPTDEEIEEFAQWWAKESQWLDQIDRESDGPKVYTLMG